MKKTILTVSALLLCLCIAAFAGCADNEEKESNTESVTEKLTEKQTETEAVYKGPQIIRTEENTIVGFDVKVTELLDGAAKCHAINYDTEDFLLDISNYEGTKIEEGTKLNLLINYDMQKKDSGLITAKNIVNIDSEDDLYFDLFLKCKRTANSNEGITIMLRTKCLAGSYAYMGSSTVFGATVTIYDKNGNELKENALNETADFVCVNWRTGDLVETTHIFTGPIPAGVYTVKAEYKNMVAVFEDAITVK